MKYVLLPLLSFVAVLSPLAVGATTIVAIWSSDRIVIAADSRRTSLLDGSYAQVCKIRNEGSVWYATAGLYEASIEGFNISKIVHEVYLESPVKEHLLGFTMYLSPAIGQALVSVRERIDAVLSTNPNLNFADIVMVAKEKDGLRAVHYRTDISRTVPRTSANGVRSMAFWGEEEDIPTKNPLGMEIIGAGRTEAIAEYIRANPQWTKERDPVSVARMFVQMEIDRHPNEVGGPIAILTIESNGSVQWKDRAACLEGK